MIAPSARVYHKIPDQWEPIIYSKKIDEVVGEMLANPDKWHDRIEEVRAGLISNLGHGGEAAGEYLLSSMLEKQEARKAASEDGA